MLGHEKQTAPHQTRVLGTGPPEESSEAVRSARALLFPATASRESGQGAHILQRGQ